MRLDIGSLLEGRRGENLALHAEHINPQFARVLKIIGLHRDFVRAEGAHLYDTDGREYLDFLSGYGVFNVGRNHPKIRQALKDFLDAEEPSLVQMEAPLLSGILAEELKKLVPNELDTVYFTSSGTEGIETAIKYARCATGKPGIVYCEHAFHGLSNGSLSLMGERWFRDGFEPLLPACRAVPLNDIDRLRAELERGDVGAFVVEPIQGKGVHVADDEYLVAASELCREHDTLFVADEVQTGLGRTGKLFAIEHSGVSPDVLVISKALSGGYVPVGAVLTRRAVYDKVFSTLDRCVVHSSTFGQGAFAMAAGLATLAVLEEEKIVENAARMGARLLDGLLDLRDRYEMISDVRGRGLMLAVEFGRPKSMKLRIGWDLAHRVDKGLFGQAIVIPLMQDHSILTQVSGHGVDVVKLIPPLIIDENDIARFLEAFEDVVRRSHRFPGPVWEVTTRLAKHALTRR